MSDTSSPVDVLFRIATGHWLSQALLVTARLGIADLLKDGPRCAEDLARACGADSGALLRLLRLLTSAGAFREDECGSFALTPVGELMTAAPGRALVQLFAGEMVQHAWKGLLYSVQTGNPAFQHECGVGPVEYLASHPEEAANFDLAMTAATTQTALALAAAYDFPECGTIVDIGGGQGVLIAAILKANPHLRGVLFDLPRVAEGARGWIESAGFGDRCEVVGGDFFESAPGGGDIYLLKHIVHGWDDQRATAILTNVRRAMKPDSRLLVIEGLYPARVDTSPACIGPMLNDMNMLVTNGGRQRSEAEFRGLFDAAGLRLSRIVALRAPASAIEAQRLDGGD